MSCPHQASDTPCDEQDNGDKGSDKGSDKGTRNSKGSEGGEGSEDSEVNTSYYVYTITMEVFFGRRQVIQVFLQPHGPAHSFILEFWITSTRKVDFFVKTPL